MYKVGHIINEEYFITDTLTDDYAISANTLIEAKIKAIDYLFSTERIVCEVEIGDTYFGEQYFNLRYELNHYRI